MLFLILCLVNSRVNYQTKNGQIEDYEFIMKYSEDVLKLDVIHNYRKYETEYDLDELDILDMIDNNPEILTKLIIFFLDGNIEYETEIIGNDFILNLKLNIIADIYETVRLVLKYKQDKEKNDAIIRKKMKELENENNKLKENIVDIRKGQLNLFRFTSDLVPETYLKISRRFPHMNLDQIIKFEKRVRDNGGSIEVHSGTFNLTKRIISTNHDIYKSIISWDCCHSKLHNGYTGIQQKYYIDKDKNDYQFNGNTRKYGQPDSFGSNEIKGAVDLTNPKPDGKCDFPETFYLYKDKKHDLENVKVLDLKSSVNDYITDLEGNIKKYVEKINKLKLFKENLDLLETL